MEYNVQIHKMKITISSILLLFVSVNALSAQQISYSSDVPVKTLRIDIERAGGGPVSELLTDLQYIPLQVADRRILKDVSTLTAIVGKQIGVFNTINSKPFLLMYSLEDGALIKAVDIVKSVKLPRNCT